MANDCSPQTLSCIRLDPVSAICVWVRSHEDGHSQCSLFSVLFVGGSVPSLLWEPLLSVALLDVVVPLQEAICCRSSVDTVTMHSSEGSEAAAAHELCIREPTLCRDFTAGVWAGELDGGWWCLAEDTNEKSRCGSPSRFSIHSNWGLSDNLWLSV